MSESAEAAEPIGQPPGRGNVAGREDVSPSRDISTSGTTPAFRERLYAAWWTWPLPLVTGGLLAAEVHMGYPGIRAWLPYLVLIPLAIALPLYLGRTKVEVVGDELRVGDACLSLRFAEGAETVPSAEKRNALGPDLDPAAFVIHRPWVGSMIRIWLDDDNDPTPYWMISTRHPDRLLELLTRDSGAATADSGEVPSDTGS